MTSPTENQCPSCGAAASGRFCAECGSPLSGAACAECRAGLTPGAKFCHRCGTPAGALAHRGAPQLKSTLPWAVAAIAMLSLIAMVAGRNLAPTRGSSLDGPSNAIPTPGLDDRAPAASGRAPDISQLTPGEAADRLFDRIMRLDEEGKTDSVQFFAPMALSAYELLPTLNADQRFHIGMIALATRSPEMTPLARAQSDTILSKDGSHLLGLTLALRAARAANDGARQRTIQERIAAVADAQLSAGKPEYDVHMPIIQDAIRSARTGGQE